MRTSRHPAFARNLLLLCFTAVLFIAAGRQTHAAGVTVITHGFGGDAQGWVLGMAQRIPSYPTFPGTNVICYEMRVVDSGTITVSAHKIAGGHPTNDPAAEIVIKLDWGNLAGFFNQYDTFEVAEAVAPKFLETNFIPELGGRALAELPLHLIGHSRGGSLVCQMARLFGRQGIWVDQVTTLDPHPVNQDGNVDPLSVTDAPLRIYENILFADNYYQDFGGYPSGQLMPSSYNRRLTSLPGGYSSAHSDTHLWYHATIDARNPANDTEATLSAGDRSVWFSAYESGGANAGFHYSRPGGGIRLGTNQPAGTGTDSIALGLNKRWDFGAGQMNNRTALNSNIGAWPNIMVLNLAGTNFMAQGETNSLIFSAQWAQPSSSNATISIHLDADLNPYNGNEQLLDQHLLPGTGSNQVAVGTIPFKPEQTNSMPGRYAIHARISVGNRSRYIYAPETVTILSSFEKPVLGITRSNSVARISVTGVPGQRIVLEATSDFSAWTAVATNWLAAPLWTYSEPTSSHRYYRAVIR